ncbi:MAG: hypothetical protein K0R66_1155 [Gammaproteobacteria bacterium]|nr:hypothetical protein [Gammaproteobacteria bacterium]
MSYIAKENSLQYTIEQASEDFYAVKTICQLFEEMVLSAPDAIAVKYGEIELSYNDLNNLANQLARCIRDRYQATLAGSILISDLLIPISIERSVNFVVGILAILKAGAAYVPISSAYPPERISYILDDTKASLILTDKLSTDYFSMHHASLEQLVVDHEIYEKYESHNLDCFIYPTDLAYVIYTSGSTGKPKGVLAQHINVVAQARCADYFHADSSDTFSFFSDVAFDSTTVEIWGALLNGSRLYIPSDALNLLSSSASLKKVLREQAITIMLLTRSLFDLLYIGDETVFESLKFLFVGGEALTKGLMHRLTHSKYKPKTLVNSYGPSENSTFCITNELKVEDDFSQFSSVPIGRPFSNRVGYVLDAYHQLLPVGIIGELFVGGPSLSRGYLNRLELTQERFIVNPISDESGYRHHRIYQTGDLVRWLPNGTLEYVGRDDFQVKLRGYRIELSEIEASMLKISGVKHSVVILAKNANLSYLIGYYVAEAPIEEAVIREHLATQLPNYMIPSKFMRLEQLPITTNGKLDRNRLPNPEFTAQSSDSSTAPKSVQESIQKAWTEVLSIHNFSHDESFFNLGGNSLAAMHVRRKLEIAFNINLNIVEMFKYPTVNKLAGRISELIMSGGASKENTQLSSAEKKSVNINTIENSAIAIVGIACRLPGVKNPDAFWQLLINDESTINDLSAEVLKMHVDKKYLDDESYVKRGAIFEDIFDFDADFFGYSVKDAEIMDPQHRHFLECAWEALEHSGNIPEKFSGDIGVFACQGRDSYFVDRVYVDENELSRKGLLQALLGNGRDFLSTRTSFKLNLTGPSMTVQTACSSSLTAIQMACESLRLRNCDMALAGGVSFFYNYGYPYQAEMIESPDGYCRSFDEKAEGTVLTSGVGIVVLKRYSDAIAQGDEIIAVIKGGALNNDGASKMNFTSPSIEGQSSVIKKALQNAAISPDTISYVEAHGTGTLLGDPIEWAALHNVYEKYTSQPHFCHVGSVKSNIGHTDSAAGVFGVIKTALMLHHKSIPATLNFNKLNPDIASFNKLFQVTNKLKAWEVKAAPRRAAVSSFGLGGTNAHMILEEFVDAAQAHSEPESISEAFYLIPFSAKSQESFIQMEKNLANFIAESQHGINYRDLAYTAQQGRSEFFKKRGYFVIGDQSRSIVSRSIQGIEAVSNPTLVFAMLNLSINSYAPCLSLYASYVDFAEAFDQCIVIIRECFGHTIEISSLEPSSSPSSSEIAKLISFSFQFALTHLVISLGIQPQSIFVEGSGACVAMAMLGLVSIDEAMRLHIDRRIAKGFTFTQHQIMFDKVTKIARHPESHWLSSSDWLNVDFWQEALSVDDPHELGQSVVEGLKSSILFILAEPRVMTNAADKVSFCISSRQQNTEQVFLDSIGTLWTYGVPIVWDRFYQRAENLKKCRMPTYPFNKKHFELPKRYSVQNFQASSDDIIVNLSSYEDRLKQIWARVLGLESTDISDSSNFIALGGDSLGFIDIFDEMKKQFKVELSLDDVVACTEFYEMHALIKNKAQG